MKRNGKKRRLRRFSWAPRPSQKQKMKFLSLSTLSAYLALANARSIVTRSGASKERRERTEDERKKNFLNERNFCNPDSRLQPFVFSCSTFFPRPPSPSRCPLDQGCLSFSSLSLVLTPFCCSLSFSLSVTQTLCLFFLARSLARSRHSPTLSTPSLPRFPLFPLTVDPRQARSASPAPRRRRRRHTNSPRRRAAAAG